MAGKEEIKEAIRNELMGWFGSNGSKAGDVLSPDWLYNEYLVTLSAREEKILEETLGELIHAGLLEYIGGRRPTYRLTEKGAASLC